jgi:putative ABC transport system permease protein
MEFRPIFSALTRNKTGALLIALQIAITMAIVTNAAFIIQQRSTDIARPSGLDEANTGLFVLVPLDPEADKKAMYTQDLRALREIPGVRAATTSNSIPVSGSGNGQTMLLSPDQPSNEAVNIGNFNVDESGLKALGLELVGGRDFLAVDVEFTTFDFFGIRTKVIISQALADALFPDGNAIGQLVWGDPSDEKPSEIIGIYAHMQNAWPHSSNVNLTALTPRIDLMQDNMTYILRAEEGRLEEVMANAEAMFAQDRSRLVRIVRTFREQKNRTYSGDIAMVKLLSGVVAILTLITSFGIIGLAWFSVTQRRKQIGTRRALGATRFDIMRYFMVENWIITSVGLVLGVGGSIALNWFLDTEYQIGRIPLFYLPVGMLSLWLLGQLAVLTPARRAAGIAPALATRSI